MSYHSANSMLLFTFFRPSFYNSAETNAEKETSLCQTEELADVAEEAVLPHASHADQPHSPPSSNLNKEELVCYSVAAVLGPQLSKPFPSFFTTPGSQESGPLSSPDWTSGSAHQSEVPYSVDAVLRSCKVEKSTFGCTPTPPTTAQSVSYTPKTDLYSVNTIIPPFGRTNHNSIFSRPPSQTSTSKRPTQLKPHLSVPTLDSQASIKPRSHSSGFTEFKGESAVPVEPATSSIEMSDSENTVSRHFAATETHLHSTKTPPGLKRGTNQQDTTETTAECSSKTAHCGDLAVGYKKTLKRPFHSLFASPITDTLQPTDKSVPSSSDYESDRVKSEPDKASARSFLSLFAAPLSATPLPCMQSPPDYSKTSSCSQKSNQPVDNTSHSSHPKQKDSGLETSLPSQVRTDVKGVSHAPRSPNSSPYPKKENKDSSTEHVNLPTKQLVNPVCSVGSDSLSKMSTSPTPCGHSLSTTHAHQQLPHISSHKGKDIYHTVLTDTSVKC